MLSTSFFVWIFTSALSYSFQATGDVCIHSQLPDILVHNSPLGSLLPTRSASRSDMNEPGQNCETSQLENCDPCEQFVTFRHHSCLAQASQERGGECSHQDWRFSVNKIVPNIISARNPHLTWFDHLLFTSSLAASFGSCHAKLSKLSSFCRVVKPLLIFVCLVCVSLQLSQLCSHHGCRHCQRMQRHVLHNVLPCDVSLRYRFVCKCRQTCAQTDSTLPALLIFQPDLLSICNPPPALQNSNPIEDRNPIQLTQVLVSRVFRFHPQRKSKEPSPLRLGNSMVLKLYQQHDCKGLQITVWQQPVYRLNLRRWTPQILGILSRLPKSQETGTGISCRNGQELVQLNTGSEWCVLKTATSSWPELRAQTLFFLRPKFCFGVLPDCASKSLF